MNDSLSSEKSFHQNNFFHESILHINVHIGCFDEISTKHLTFSVKMSKRELFWSNLSK